MACTEEAKLCPDGSAVGRTGPDCAFAPCPSETQETPAEPEEQIFCTADVQECPDGSFVSRVPPTCAFAPCLGQNGGTPVESEQIAPGETETAKSCQSKGGEWQRRYIGYFCNYPANDAGKSCTDGSQCAGDCIVEEPGVKQGRCSDYQVVYGCTTLMKDGKALGICID